MFDQEIRIQDFEIEREIRKPLKTDFTSEKSVLMEDFNQEMDLLFTVRLVSPKKDL